MTDQDTSLSGVLLKRQAELWKAFYVECDKKGWKPKTDMETSWLWKGFLCGVGYELENNNTLKSDLILDSLRKREYKSSTTEL